MARRAEELPLDPIDDGLSAAERAARWAEWEAEWEAAPVVAVKERASEVLSAVRARGEV